MKKTRFILPLAAIIFTVFFIVEYAQLRESAELRNADIASVIIESLRNALARAFLTCLGMTVFILALCEAINIRRT
ncbi:MAG: hypothetical protein RL150_175 [Candidatus Parcubacteria bacterium]|jgi:ABC-type Fe3+ transport system permease subunit